MSSKKTSSVYNRVYSDMGGVDFSGEPSQISPHRFSYLENMYRDYDARSGGGVETIPGFRTAYRFDHPIRAFHRHPSEKNTFLVHAGEELYPIPAATIGLLRKTDPIPGREGFTLASARSRGVITSNLLLLADGTRYSCCTGEEIYPPDSAPYVPTTYSDGEPFEQRNMLTNDGVEEYHLLDYAPYRYASPEIIYEVRGGYCTVVGLSATTERLIIPAVTEIGGVPYAVAAVADDALRGNQTVKTLIISEGVTVLGKRAFYEMSKLTTVILPSTVVSIPEMCFGGCKSLTSVYLSRELQTVAERAFESTSLYSVYFNGTPLEYASIQGTENIVPALNPLNCQILYNYRYRREILVFPFAEQVHSVKSVTLSKTKLAETEIHGKEGFSLIARPGGGEGEKALLVELDTGDLHYGETLRIEVEYEERFFELISTPGIAYRGTGASAINRCRLIAAYEGRVFLSGNPDLPGFIFYSQWTKSGKFDPGYFGLYNYFTDGNGKAEVLSLLATATYLLVLTEDNHEGASVFFHTGADSGNDVVPRIYPAIEGTGGVRAVGEAAVFLDDTVFLTELGLMGIEKQSLSEERSIVPRSSAVDAKLTVEVLKRARCFRYASYLGVAVDGRIYLADGRQRTVRDGHTEYEWYFLSDIGEYVGQENRYHLCSRWPNGIAEGDSFSFGGVTMSPEVSKSEDYLDGETVYSAITTKGFPFCYVMREGHALLADCTGEQTGGSFSAAVDFIECAKSLFFGTENGGLFIFNTDMRGEDGIIPRCYYTFNGRAYRSGCATKSDHCDIPHLAKNTVRGSGAVKLKAMTGGKVFVRVQTDREGWSTCDVLHGGRLDYNETDFASAEFRAEPETVVPMREAKRRWAEKRLYFISEEYQRPFGIITIAYQYRVAGRIKA